MAGEAGGGGGGGVGFECAGGGFFFLFFLPFFFLRRACSQHREIDGWLSLVHLPGSADRTGPGGGRHYHCVIVALHTIVAQCSLTEVLSQPFFIFLELISSQGGAINCDTAECSIKIAVVWYRTHQTSRRHD